MFADIMLPLEAWACRFDRSPRSARSCTTHAARPGRRTPCDRRGGGGDALRVRGHPPAPPRAVRGRAALIGFAGAPFTLACYLIEGRPSRDYAKAKGLMYGAEATWHASWRRSPIRSSATCGPGPGRRAGRAALRLLGRRALADATTRRYSRPTPGASSRRCNATGVPTIHFGTGARQPARADGRRRQRTPSAWTGGYPWMRPGERIGPGKGIQGNLDPGAAGPLRGRAREADGSCDGPAAAPVTSSIWATASFRRRPGAAGPTGAGRPSAAEGPFGGNGVSAGREVAGVLLMTYGSPATLEDVPAYLGSVRGGREPTSWWTSSSAATP